MSKSKAQACLMGLLAGDNLGGLVEFKSPEAIAHLYPDGITEMRDGGTWNIIAGQPTDDGEMALSLTHSILECGKFDVEDAHKRYLAWIDSDPFDCGMTISSGLRGFPNDESQANGALMRVAPLGIFLAGASDETIFRHARLDCALTHPNPICMSVNAIYVGMISYAISNDCTPTEVFNHGLALAEQWSVGAEIIEVMQDGKTLPAFDYMTQAGWVLVAFQNAIWQLLHASSFEEAISNTAIRGGDTDTNAAICGALFGACHGMEKFPEKWRVIIENCKPQSGKPNVARPRPQNFWPNDAMNQAARLYQMSKHDAN